MKQLADLARYQLEAAAKRRLLELGKIRILPYSDAQVETPTPVVDVVDAKPVPDTSGTNG